MKEGISVKIGVVTTTRSEYGLLKRLIKHINNDIETDLCLIVTGTHLLEEYGMTVKYIEEDGFPISVKVPIEIDTSCSSAISTTMGRYFLAFSRVFETNKMDFLIVLGDRYELIPICYCAANAHIPIAHISGGEITEGAIDDAVRHSITKLSYLHFPACETYRNRIIQLGEDPARVFNVGDPGVENIKKMFLLPEDVVRKKFALGQTPYFVVIFHPITLDEMKPREQIKELLAAIDIFDDIRFVIMKANSDLGGQEINEYLNNFVDNHMNCTFFSSLKIEDFLSLQKFSMGLIGNSSSGIVETPCFGIPTINIGDRQKGRLCAESIISCGTDKEEIVASIRLAMTDSFKEKAKNAVNPYGYGETSNEIIKYIKEFIKGNKVDLKKGFYDITV